MNSSQLQFVLTMLLVIDGIMCNSEQIMLQCQYRGNNGISNFTVAAHVHSGMSSSQTKKVNTDVSLDVSASITCVANYTWTGIQRFSFEIVCPEKWQILLRVSPMDIGEGIVVEAFDKMNRNDDTSSQDKSSNYPIFLLSKTKKLKIEATYSADVMLNKKFTLSARTAKVIKTIDREPSDSSPSEQGNGAWILELSYPTTYSFDIVLVTFDYCNEGSSMDDDEYLTIICWELDGVNEFSFPSLTLNASCSRTSNTLLVNLIALEEFDIENIRIVLAELPSVGFNSVNPMNTVTTTGQPQSTTANPTTTVTTITPPQPTSANTTTTVKTNGSSKSNSGNTASIVVPPVVVLVAVFLLVALVASIWRKRRNKQTSALNIRSTVNQNEDTVVYNEIREQDYNTLFGGKERDDYHEYNVPDLPQGKTSVDRTTASGSGPYQELFQDETRAVAAVNRSPGVTGHRHGVAGDLNAYQDIRQDDRSVRGSHPNGEMPNQLPSKDTPAAENGYQALRTATPEYATLEPSPEYATLEQNDESMTATSDVSGPPSDKQYDTLQQSINTVGQPPSAGYGTLKPMNEADADYESPDGYSKTTSDVNDSTRPTEALPNNQPKTRHPGAYGDDDYQTPIEPAEDLTNAYQTLDNPGYQQEPDTQAEEYSQLQRSLGAKLQSHPSSNHDNSDSYGKLPLNGTP